MSSEPTREEIIEAVEEMLKRFAADQKLWPATRRRLELEPVGTARRIQRVLHVGPWRRNAIHCCGCGDTIESRHRHDFRQCSCEVPWAVDGGTWYIRRLAGRSPVEGLSQRWPWEAAEDEE